MDQTSDRALLIWGRAQRAALAGDVMTAADLLSHAAQVLHTACDWIRAARAYLDLSILACELGEPRRQSAAVASAMEMLHLSDDPACARALDLLRVACQGGASTSATVSLARVMLPEPNRNIMAVESLPAPASLSPSGLKTGIA